MIFWRIRTYLQSLDAARTLESELVITGHGTPIHGAATVRADLDAMRAAVTHIERETIAGMNAGKTVHKLMRDITLPADGQIGEFRGKTDRSFARSGKRMPAGSTTPTARPDCTTCHARQ